MPILIIDYRLKSRIFFELNDLWTTEVVSYCNSQQVQ